MASWRRAVAGQAEQIVDLMVLTPPHQLLSGKAGVGPQQDLDLEASRSRRRDDALDVLRASAEASMLAGLSRAESRWRPEKM